MSEIVEAVAKAITHAINESERVQILTRDEMMAKAASAAIEAYEAAKTRDLMAGMLSHNITMDGDKMVVKYVERGKWFEGTKMDDMLRSAVNRLAERKP